LGWIGGQELLLIFVVILLVFGPRKIPEVARGIGKGLREFRRLTTDFQREINLAESEGATVKKVESAPKPSSEAAPGEEGALEPPKPGEKP
jgi:TatA/E family protein of Tat protein translocase